MKYIYAFALGVSLLFIISGCMFLEDPLQPEPGPGANINANHSVPGNDSVRPVKDARRDTLRLSMRPPLTLNPLLNEDITVDRILKLIFEPLAALDETLKPAGHLAELEFAYDYASVNIRIPDEAIWSDGVPVTADDVLFTVATLRNAGENVIYKNTVKNIASCEKLDNKAVKITFYEATGNAGFALQFPVIPHHYYKNEKNPSSAKNMTPLGNGLYVFDALSPMKSISLTYSSYNFRATARIENIEVLFISDSRTELDAFSQGLIDVIAMEIPEWYGNNSVKAIRYAEFPSSYFEFIGFNYQRELFHEPLIREGIAHAFNADEAIQAVYLSHAVRAFSPINPASWLYDSHVPVYIYDKAQAESLLRRAGRPNLRIVVNDENDERKKIAERLAAGINAAGMNAAVECLPFDQYLTKLENRDYDLFVGGYYLSYEPDIRFMLHSGGPVGEGNLFSLNDPILDGLLEAVRVSRSESSYIRAFSQLQYYIAEKLPLIGLAFRRSAVLTDTRILGDLKPSAGNIYANINEWYIQ